MEEGIWTSERWLPIALSGTGHRVARMLSFVPSPAGRLALAGLALSNLLRGPNHHEVLNSGLRRSKMRQAEPHSLPE